MSRNRRRASSVAGSAMREEKEKGNRRVPGAPVPKVYFLHWGEPAAAQFPDGGNTHAKTSEEIKVQIIDISVKFFHYEEDVCCFFLPMTDTGHPNRIGYARVSTTGQNLDSQLDALTKEGCLRIFSDQMGGTTKERPGWDALRAYLRPGDTVARISHRTPGEGRF